MIWCAWFYTVQRAVKLERIKDRKALSPLGVANGKSETLRAAETSLTEKQNKIETLSLTVKLKRDSEAGGKSLRRRYLNNEKIRDAEKVEKIRDVETVFSVL